MRHVPMMGGVFFMVSEIIEFKILDEEDKGVSTLIDTKCISKTTGER
jgi:hypothetical protein